MLEHGKPKTSEVTHLFFAVFVITSDVCSLTDSPFSDGLGNDYLFVGNMVYTVRDYSFSNIYALFCLLPCRVLDDFLYSEQLWLLQSIYSRLATLSPLDTYPLLASPLSSTSHSYYQFTPHSLEWISHGLYLLRFFFLFGGFSVNRNCWIYYKTFFFIISSVNSKLIIFLFIFYLPPLPSVCVCV